MPTVHSTIFKTLVNDEILYEGSDQETAIRTWDSQSITRAKIIGGIEVQSFDSDGVMIRDGWLLHVNESGHVYLNPRT